MTIRRRRLAIIATAGLVACGVDLAVPSGAVVTCRSSSECPTGTSCILDVGICTTGARPCVEAAGADFRTAADGNQCTTDGGENGTCFRGSCTVCGNGVVDEGEECDDGNTANADACLQTCRSNTCGDGFVNTGVEECDDGNPADTDGCLTSCLINVCGDRIINVGVETCEDGNDDDNDGCGQCVLTSWSVAEDIGYGPWGGNLDEVYFGLVGDIAVDPAGNIYVSDWSRHVIWRVEAGSRRARIYAGRAPVANDEGMPAMQASLYYPMGLATDRLGNLFVVDQGHYRILRIDYRTQVITRVAGSYGCFTGTCGDGGPALAAGMGYPLDVALDNVGGIYVSDELLTTGSFSGRLRYISPNGTISQWRGVDSPEAVAAYGTNSLLYTETNASSPFHHKLTRWTSGGGFQTVSGDIACASPTSSCGDGAVTGGRFNYPVSLAATELGDKIFIADRNDNKIRLVTPTTVSTIAGTGGPCSGDCESGEDAKLIGINGPQAITLGPDESVYFIDGARRIRRLTPNGATYRLETIGGSRISEPVYSGTAGTASKFQEPRIVAAAADGTAFVGESPSRRLYRVDPDGLIYRLSGSAVTCTDPTNPCGDGLAADTVPTFYRDDTGLAADAAGNVFFFDGPTGRLRRIARAGNILSTIAGNGVTCAPTTAPCGDGGAATAASFTAPSDIATAPDGSLYVSDLGGFRIRRIDPTGSTSTFVGTGIACAGPASCGDSGPRTTATLQGPRAVTVAANGDVYFFDGDGTNTTLRRIVAGGANVERLHAATNFSFSSGLAFDDASQSLLAGFDGEVRRYSVSGATASFAGVTDAIGCTSASDGVSALNWCIGNIVDVARSATGDVFVANYDGGVKRVSSTGIISTLIGQTDPLGTGSFTAGNLERPRQILHAPTAAGADVWWVANGFNVAAVDHVRRRIDGLVGYGFGPTNDGVVARYRGSFGDAAGVALDTTASPMRLFIADAAGNQIFVSSLVNPADPRTWLVSLYAGSSTGDHVNGPRASARFRQPMGLAYDESSGILYVADRGNHVIRAIDATSVTTVVGIPTVGLPDFDVPTGVPLDDAHLFFPEGVTLERVGGGLPNLLIADTGNHQVRRVDRVAQRVHVIAGDGSAGIAGSGTARFVAITSPRSVAVDSFGNLFVASGFTVRQVLAGDDGVATGDDELITIYGNRREDAPMSATACLSGIGVAPGDDRVSFTDVCSGFYVQLSREAL